MIFAKSNLTPFCVLASLFFISGDLYAQSQADASAKGHSSTKLTQQDVVDSVLEKSLEARAIEYRAEQSLVDLELAGAPYDFMLTANSSYNYSEAESITGLSNPLDKTLSADWKLSKPTYFGTVFEIGYEHIAQNSVLNPIVTNTRGSTATLDQAYLQVRQPLWRNVFGLSDRLSLRAAEGEVSVSDLKKEEETEELVLKAIELYWKAYTAQTILNDTIAARERYQRLIKVVERRGRFGLEKGGEYAQVMADYWDAEAQVKTASFDYLSVVNELAITMGREFSGDLEFVVNEPIPALPKIEKVELSSLRPVKIEKQNLENTELKSRASNNGTSPKLDVVLKGSSTGVASQADLAYTELVEGTHPGYYVGVEFSTSLDSSKTRSTRAQSRLNENLAEHSLALKKRDLSHELADLELKVPATYERAKASVEVEKFRSRTVNEQEREYRSGRLTLKDLLQTYKGYFTAQSQKVQAIGEYQLTRNQLAAARDELVKTAENSRSSQRDGE